MASRPFYPSRLRADLREIRVIKLEPGDRFSPIQCVLMKQSLDSLPTYHALSYVWGDPECTSNIHIHGLAVPVTQNLERALRHIRREEEALMIWVDALCINQKDTKERNQQVALMGRIYTSASTVLIWIGDSDELSDFAFDSISDVSNDIADELTKSNVCSFYLDLRNRSWFNRLWIIQELALAAHDPVVFCGNKSTPWSLFLSAWKALSLHFFKEIGMVREQVDSTGEVPSKSIEVVASIKLDTLDDIRRSVGTSATATFAQLYHYSHSSEATEPRDRVYGLLGMLPDSDRAEFTIDYEMPVSQVYAQAMAHIFNKGEGPWFLSGMWLHAGNSPIPDLPSWVLDFSAQTAEKAGHPGSISFWPPSPMSASGAGAGAKNGQVCDDNRTLRVEALIADVIKTTLAFGPTIEDCIQQLNLVEELVAKSLAVPASEGPLKPFYEKFRSSEPIWRILVSGKKYSSGYDPAPAAYGHAYNSLVARVSQQQSRDQPLLPHEDEMLSEYRQSLQSHVLGRVLFSTENGLVGIGPPGVCSNDQVTIWFGAPTAFITRPCNMDSLGKCRLIGAAYVGGIMHGEMVDELYCEDLMNSTTLLVI